MSSVFMIVADVLRDQSLQVPLVQGNHVIEQVASATFDPTLGNAILPGAWAGSSGRCAIDEDCSPSIFCISVKDQEAGNGIERGSLSQLLHDPHARGMLGDVEMQNFPSLMADNEEAVEHAECNRWHRKKVHCGNCFAMVLDECEPAL
jgi:hypothetical protein